MDWTEEMDRHFIGLMLELVHGGNGIGRTAEGTNWSRIISLFNEKFGLQFDKSIFEQRYTFLMKQHDEISSTLSHVGFSWDEIQQTVTAEDHVWEAYIRVSFISFGIHKLSSITNQQKRKGMNCSNLSAQMSRICFPAY